MSRYQPYFRVYTAGVEFVAEYLSIVDHRQARSFLVRLFDFVLMHFPEFQERDPSSTPDTLLLEILKIVRDKRLLQSGGTAGDPGEAERISRLFEVVERILHLDDETTLISHFLQHELSEAAERIKEQGRCPWDMAYLNQCKRALLLRQKHHGVFSTPVNSKLNGYAQTFINELLRSGFFLIDKDGNIGGDTRCLARLIIDDVLEQAMFDRVVFCPMVSLSVVCHQRCDFCGEDLVTLTSTLSAKQHVCALSILLGIVDVGHASPRGFNWAALTSFWDHLSRLFHWRPPASSE
jgi:hypothetical protein